ncbi:MAG: rod shape-determining protein MreC [Patescibacteria group bacterium]|nr:rod shape-determining protein MreC [Patescibacteria group bacterium]
MVSRKIKYFVFFILVLLLIVFYRLGWLFFIGQIMLPFQKLFFQSESKSWQQKIVREEEKLKNEIERLTLENIKLKLLEKENEELKKELGYQKNSSYRRKVCRLIGRQTEAGVTWFILDQGEEEGIKIGQAVVSGDVVVGKIAKVTKYFSYLLPLTDERTTFSALTISSEGKIKEENKVSGLVRGKWGLSLEMDWIPLAKKINVGDYVITAGLEENIPQGLLIGRIGSIENKVGAIFQKAVVLPEKKIEDLNIVSVIVMNSRQ